jgi:carbonic anhydrase
MLDELESRRKFLRFACAGIAGASLGVRTFGLADQPAGTDHRDSATSLKALIAGNARFASGHAEHPERTPADFLPLAAGQKPIATIFSCADSRVPPEIVFDRGIGELFIVRVAGNYVSGAGAAVKGSLEYSVAVLGVPLIMVLGHSNCGAVKSAIEHLEKHDSLPGSINELVNYIKPAVIESEHEPGDRLANAVRANVRRSVERLKGLEPILAPAVKSGRLRVVGGVYKLETGKVVLLS